MEGINNMKRHSKPTARLKGFTIVELVIVIAVIAVLAAVLVPVFSGIINKAKESRSLQEANLSLTKAAIAFALQAESETLDGYIVNGISNGSPDIFANNGGKLERSDTQTLKSSFEAGSFNTLITDPAYLASSSGSASSIPESSAFEGSASIASFLSGLFGEEATVVNEGTYYCANISNSKLYILPTSGVGDALMFVKRSFAINHFTVSVQGDYELFGVGTEPIAEGSEVKLTITKKDSSVFPADTQASNIKLYDGNGREIPTSEYNVQLNKNALTQITGLLVDIRAIHCNIIIKVNTGEDGEDPNSGEGSSEEISDEESSEEISNEESGEFSDRYSKIIDENGCIDSVYYFDTPTHITESDYDKIENGRPIVIYTANNCLARMGDIEYHIETDSTGANCINISNVTGDITIEIIN